MKGGGARWSKMAAKTIDTHQTTQLILPTFDSEVTCLKTPPVQAFMPVSTPVLVPIPAQDTNTVASGNPYTHTPRAVNQLELFPLVCLPNT